MEGGIWITTFGMIYGGDGNDRSLSRMRMKDIKEVMRLSHFPRKLAMTEGLKLKIFTCKWGKCVKPVGKYLLESFI